MVIVVVDSLPLDSIPFTIVAVVDLITLSPPFLRVSHAVSDFLTLFPPLL
ncbi:hypothetical protein DEO72_LG7g2254 [Vigna unguiculata]|uniref:Uncharacterized protein n=1 Tax=Vigna unguiculata TaxID=3917 RepID=A0A4D6MHQ6_VIGUN|nr:hypothetical protein DEO72_LG7g2254 [Vigna unguiculata]